MTGRRRTAARTTASRRPLRAPMATRATALHAGAWWLWALGLAAAATRTTNPLLLGLIIAVAGYVVAARRTDAPWARAFGFFLVLGAAVVLLRVLFAVALGSHVGGTHTLFVLPEVPLPEWMQGVRLGGRVVAEGVLFAFYDGLRLATVLICVGAANALANPARLLKSLPGALYEVGMAVVVAMTFAPHLIADAFRLRAARRLRGRPDRGVRGLAQVALPVLEGALERSVALAAAMDARGYGRTAHVPARIRRTTAALTVGGLLGVCAGSYGLLAAEGAAFGVPVLLVGVAAALAGLWLGGRRTVRSRYRPDRWGTRAWLVSGSGLGVAALLVAGASADPTALQPPTVPLAAPDLPLFAAAAVLLGLLPALVAPVPEDADRPAARRGTSAGGPAGDVGEDGHAGREGDADRGDGTPSGPTPRALRTVRPGGGQGLPHPTGATGGTRTGGTGVSGARTGTTGAGSTRTGTARADTTRTGPARTGEARR